MSFTIIRLTKRAHGGDPIERRKTVDGPEITIGRGTDCDVLLSDLAVGLKHATVKVTAPGRVTVEAMGDLSFETNGRVVRHAELRVADKPGLVFGGYRLVFTPGEAKDEIVVTVSQIDTSEVSDASAIKKIFSLGPNMFSLRRWAWLLGILILLTALAAPVAYNLYLDTGKASINPEEQWSPGSLSQGHAFLAHNCKACHGRVFHSISDTACLACHRTWREGEGDARTLAFERVHDMGSPNDPIPALDHANSNLLRQAEGTSVGADGVLAVFQSLFDHPNRQCVSCHTEHVGKQGQQPPIGGPAHPTARQVLESDCTTCHANLKAHVADTALTDVPNWDRHPNFKPLMASLMATGRPISETAAIAQGPFDTGLRFSHLTHVTNDKEGQNTDQGDVATKAHENNKPLGPHGGLACTACHHPDNQGRGFRPASMLNDCEACHSLDITIAGQNVKLKHGQPDIVVAQLRSFFEGGSGSDRAAEQRPGAVHYATGAASGPLPEAEMDRLIRRQFTEVCEQCHDFTFPSDSSVPKIVPMHLTDRYLPKAGFDHAVRWHLVDANGKPICTTCHAVLTSKLLADTSIPTIENCRTCHGNSSPPPGVPAHVSADCTECHGYHTPGSPPTREVWRGAWQIPGGS